MLIGIMGIKRSGKDTIANILTSQYDFIRISFADALYQEIADLFGVSTDFLRKDSTKEKPLKELELSKIQGKVPAFVDYCMLELGMFLTRAYSPRAVLQIYGGWCRTAFGETYWTDKVFDQVKANPDKHYCIADVRYKNEYELVLQNEGEIWKVFCQPIYDKWYAAYSQGCSIATHISETDLLDVQPTHLFENVWGDMNALTNAVNAKMKSM